MFQLSVISDLIRIPPNLFHLPIRAAAISELHKKYANKVVPKLGLIICIWDMQEIQDGLLKPGDGASYVNARFRCIVWKPFIGEILQGWIESCTAEGIKVKMDFFNDIFIPKNYLFENSSFSADDNAWIWSPDDETQLYLDVNEKISFRVEEEVFTNVKPKGPANATDEEDEKTNDGPPPYAIVASCQTDGMGCVSWWE